MKSFFKGKRVLVTCACGTAGKELIQQLLDNYKICRQTQKKHFAGTDLPQGALGS
jgi:hypothetical protein